MPESMMLAPNETVWFVDEDAVVDYLNPTDDEINAGANISCAIEAGYSLNFTDPDFDTSRSICDTGNPQNPMSDNYEANITFFRSDLVTTTAVYVTAWNLFKLAGVRGYLYRRIGKGFTAPAAAGDFVSVFGVESDHAQDILTDNQGPVRFRQEFLTTGKAHYYINVEASV